MRFKIHSFIFIFVVACFLLFSYTPIQGGMQEKDIFSGDPLSKKQQKSFFTKISNLNTVYQEQKFDKIGKLFWEFVNLEFFLFFINSHVYLL